VTIRESLPPKLRAVLNGELTCSACRQRPPATGNHRRCWQCSRTGNGTPPPCKGCGGPQWFSGWCMDCHPRMRPPLSAPRSCQSCFALGILPGRFCSPCAQFSRRYPAGTCEGCGRQAAIRRGHCRLCHCQAQYLADSSPWDTGPLHVRELGPGGHQLFFASMVAVSWNHGRKEPGLPAAPVQPGPGAMTRREAVPCQPELFTLPFEVTPWRILDGDWPRISWYDHLLPAVARTGQLRGWSPSVQEHVRNTLRSLIATQPADARTYPASAVQRLGAGPRHSTARTIELLTDLQLLAEDRPDPGDPWAAKRLAKLPDGIARDVGPWLDHLRHGDSRHRPKAPGTWRGYCTAIMPALLAWAQDHDTLREITRDDIIMALSRPRPRGGDNHTQAIALRSLFGYLKTRKRIFANPASRLPANIGRHRNPTLPVPVRSEAPAPADAPMPPDEWLVNVLIRHHALPGTIIAALTLDDIDLDRRALTVAGRRRPLDQLTRDAVTSYRAYRTRRWPLTANRHLLLSQLSALEDGPVSSWWISERITRWNSTLTGLRQDRILEEAAATGTRDPMHLASMFGLHPNTAQRYVDAVYGRHDLAAAGYAREE
jgi:hypothetical protein